MMGATLGAIIAKVVVALLGALLARKDLKDSVRREIYIASQRLALDAKDFELMSRDHPELLKLRTKADAPRMSSFRPDS